MSTKFSTRDSSVEDINIKEFLLFSQDKSVTNGNKFYYRIPLRDLKKLDLTINQHLYESLPPDEAVKPYFDLEMEFPGLDEETIYDRLDLFLTWLMEEIKTVFEVNLVQEDFVILNSSRENKLSFHIVIQEHICFASVEDHKVFIEYLWHRFLNPVNEKEQEMVALLSYGFKDKIRFIFDKVPYSNFQNIRLVGQTKMGKPHVLVNVNQKWNDHETLIRLYNGIGDRKLANVEKITYTKIKEIKSTTVLLLTSRKVSLHSSPATPAMVTMF
jgi:hypothetical protein